MTLEPFGDFRDTMKEVSEYLRNIQRDGWNANLFESVVDLLPDPNKPCEEDPHNPDVLDKVQHSLCEQDDGNFYYAFSRLLPEPPQSLLPLNGEFLKITGLYPTNGWHGQIRDDLYYWKPRLTAFL